MSSTGGVGARCATVNENETGARPAIRIDHVYALPLPERSGEQEARAAAAAVRTQRSADERRSAEPMTRTD